MISTILDGKNLWIISGDQESAERRFCSKKYFTVHRQSQHTLPWQKCSYYTNCTCGECAIYGQIIISGAMIGIEVFNYREHTVLALTLEKIWGVNLLIYLLAN